MLHVTCDNEEETEHDIKVTYNECKEPHVGYNGLKNNIKTWQKECFLVEDISRSIFKKKFLKIL